MRFLPVLGLAASAGAFLVIPDVNIEGDVLPEGLEGTWSQTIELDCPRCPVRMPHSDDVTTEMESHLEMSFKVDTFDGKRLSLNGFEIYPRANPFSSALTAPHIVDMPEGSWDRKGMMRGGMMHSGSSDKMSSVDPLGFTLSTKSGYVDDDDDFIHVIMDLQIIEVSDVFVDDIPSIRVELVKDDVGVIAIHKIEILGTENPSTTDTDDGDESKCSSWLCNWIASLENHWNHWRPHCGMGHKNQTEHHRPGHHQGPHHGHHGHHGEQPDQLEQPQISYGESQRSWGQVMWSVTTHILLPVLIGIVAGVAMSIVGMVVGTLFVHVYRMVFRSSCPRRRAVPTIVVVEEKSGLMEHQEPPPSYEEGPAENTTDSKV